MKGFVEKEKSRILMGVLSLGIFLAGCDGGGGEKDGDVWDEVSGDDGGREESDGRDEADLPDLAEDPGWEDLLPDDPVLEDSIEEDIDGEEEGFVCGNGIPEGGEECDDGNGVGGDGCEADCTFSCHDGFDCDDGHGCTEDLCDGESHVCGSEVMMPEAPCREAKSDCDFEEQCDGFSPDCPVDEFRPSGTVCEDGDACTVDVCDGSGVCVGTSTTLLQDVRTVCAGLSFACALMQGGAIKCWGRNAEGQLGDGSTVSSARPVDVVGLGGLAAQISCGMDFACARMAWGGLKCWGGNFYGQLGDGTTTGKSSPVGVLGLGFGVSSVSAGFFHACAVLDVGAAMCWGKNDCGQLGDGTTYNSAVPLAVAGLSSGIGWMAPGQGHSCALTTGGGVLCWGCNERGQLGDGTTTSSLIAVPVTGLSSGIVVLDSGLSFSCAMTFDGRIKCWGENADGELGDGQASGSWSSVPVDVLESPGGPSVYDMIHMDLGGEHACTMPFEGGLRCWGRNEHGYLGDGTTISRTTPVEVTGFPPGTATRWVSGGRFSTCAVLDPGVARCWGDNTDGGLGDGTTVQSLVPVDVVCR